MHSWKYKKKKDEQRKARRKERNLTRISHANNIYMNNILQGKSEFDENKIESDFLKRMRVLIWRSVFKGK